MKTQRLEPILLIDGHYGIYIPQTFYERYNPQNSYWIWDFENSEELNNPSNEFYWETWEDIIDNAYMIDENTGIKYTLYQNDDLWAIPEGYENKEFFN